MKSSEVEESSISVWDRIFRNSDFGLKKNEKKIMVVIGLYHYLLGRTERNCLTIESGFHPNQGSKLCLFSIRYFMNICRCFCWVVLYLTPVHDKANADR